MPAACGPCAVGQPHDARTGGEGAGAGGSLYQLRAGALLRALHDPYPEFCCVVYMNDLRILAAGLD